ncbi:DoxX family protein [Streptococcus porcinus]|uniref:hypothetical protein n=1 Tax=Streptococcus porcinus TaxID=1340 RepID=UPI0010CAB3BD|nr:hypothetical protein [Streptococcus porcinus]VTS23855.1 DoxX family protein [Streptococcus porcinus]
MKEKLNHLQPYTISLLRIVSGYMIMCHGVDNVFGLFGVKVPPASLMRIGGLIELGAGLF